ncbi:adhesion G-protein coupled receptor D1-like [Anneissia japonica]|uniref:adhesion G-protein coupled receptor D1-like n=1 Tax=Anneissia japonica TaxID=1529436 RepID=UPI0014255195|nr:adhesion G-protein coupled receptor D1-like [Anneissia japonica]
MLSVVGLLFIYLLSICQADSIHCTSSQCQPRILPDHYWTLDSRCLDDHTACSENIGTSGTCATEEVPETSASPTGVTSRSLPTLRGPRGNCVIYLDQTQSDSIDFGEFANTCLTRLELCKRGLTVSVWMKIDTDRDGRMYYVSSGGQTGSSRGIAIFGSRNIETYGNTFTLTTYVTDLQTTWIAETQELPPNGRWTHVAFTWSQHHGLRLLIDGQQEDQDRFGTPSDNNNYQYTRLILGRPNSVENYFGTAGFSDLRIYYQHLENHDIAEELSSDIFSIH